MNEANVAAARPLSHLLRMAVMAGVESAVQVHIDRGDDLNARDAEGMTPLMIAAARNKSAVCRLLLGAGADHGLFNPSGNTALEIAVESGSKDTAAILGALNTPRPPLPELANALDPPLHHLAASPLVDSPVNQIVTTDAAQTFQERAPEPKALGMAPESSLVAQPWLVIEMGGVGEFDVSEWEAEEAAAPPLGDMVVLDSATAIQRAITSHEPIDTSIEWDDVDAYLPEQALPLARSDDAEGRALLRRFLLRAIREGSVPGLQVQALSTNDDRSANAAAEALLTMVINDLGAEVDERFEYADACESFEVFVDPEETPDEEATLDLALAAIDRAASLRHEPLRIYQREFQQLKLLTAEEEVELAQAMETALEAALDALATWPDGIARTLAAGADAIGGRRTLSSIWLGDAEPDAEDASVDNLDADSTSAVLAEESLGEDGEPTPGEPLSAADSGFTDALGRIGALVKLDDGEPPSVHEIRLALAALRLNRRFLMELENASAGPATCPGFTNALIAFRKARDRMTTANLKLAFFNAKKYLYSGEPLDDLAQEGNIGLLKAVDRFEWRRGFRFSTYATWWIRQQIGRHVADKARTIRVPVHIYEKMQRIEREAVAFATAFGREATPDELALRTGMPSRRIAALLRISPEPLPMDELAIDEMIAIDVRDLLSPRDPADAVDEMNLRAAVDRLLASLPNKDEQILRLRFGFGVDEAMTLDEVGQLYSVTRERIRQIEAKAIKKLKHPARAEPFARLAFGVKLEPRAFESADQEPDSVDVSEGAEHEADPAPEQPTAHLVQRVTAQAVPPPKPSSLDRLLAQATELGVPVDDGRSTSSGRIWVSLMDVPDNAHRRLARQLLEFGFEHWPGKGYWR